MLLQLRHDAHHPHVRVDQVDEDSHAAGPVADAPWIPTAPAASSGLSSPIVDLTNGTAGIRLYVVSCDGARLLERLASVKSLRIVELSACED